MKGVRVERLKDISNADAMAEGYPVRDVKGAYLHAIDFESKTAFLDGEWAKDKVDENPWVWVIEFERVQS